jgi:hypothetical protein
MSNTNISPTVNLPITSTSTESNTPVAPQAQNGIMGVAARVPGDIAKGISDVPVVGKATATAMNWAGKPLQEVQKDYKFIHSLYADHGIAAGILGTLGVIAGGFIGSFAGPEGIALGAGLAASAERNILGRVVPSYKDSFNKSNDPNYQVSFGRDLAHGLSNVPGFGTLANTNTGVGQIVSGIADASFDFEADPLANLGKVKAGMRNGDYIAEAKDKTGDTILDGSGKPVAQATLPLASSRPGLQQFFLENSNKIASVDQFDAAIANRVGGASLNRAIDDIASMKNPVEITNTYGARLGWSRNLTNALAKADDADQVKQVFRQAIYSSELADDAKSPLAELRLPTKTFGKVLSEKIGVDRIKNSVQGTTLNDQQNFLLPKRSPILDPVLNEDGTQAVGENNEPLFNQRLGSNGEPLYKINKPVWASPSKEAVMNALAGKVRTFTGRRPLSFIKDDNALSSREIDFSDPNAGQTLYDIAYLAMPHRVALERASDILTATDEEARLSKTRALWKEVAKNYGIADQQANKIFGQIDDAVGGNGISNATYLVNKGQTGGHVDLLPEYGGETKPMAIVQDQRFKGKMYDLHELRQGLRESRAYGALYNKADDFFTNFTNRIFAPLTLLSGGFGLRVSAGEALHQVMRKGLPDYLNNVLSGTLSKMSKDYQQAHKDAIAQGLSETDLDAIEKEQATGVPQKVTNTEITDELHAKETGIKAAFNKANQAIGSKQSWNNAINSTIDARNRFMPFGWAANKFLKSNLVPYFIRDKIKYMDEFHNLFGTSSHLPTGIDGGHELASDLDADSKFDIFAKVHGHGNVAKMEMAGLTADDPNYYRYWAKNISMARNDLAQRDIAKDYYIMNRNPQWRAMSEDEKFASLVDKQVARLKNPNVYKEYRDSMDGYKKAVPESFAKAQVDYLQGLVHGQGNVVNEDIIKSIMDNEPLTAKDLKSIPNEQLPIKVLGHQVQPTLSDALRRAENVGYRTFVTPVINYVSRHPLFTDFYTRRRVANQPLVDMGLLDKDGAARLSATQATRDMVPAIHSPAIRSQFAVIHRNLLPFYFAQEQAMRRVGRLIMSNPQAFRDFQIIQQGLNNPGFVHTDADGQKYIVYPGLGEFGNAVARGLNALGMKQFTGLPESITGNTSSLLTVLPEMKMPGVGPFVNLGLSEVSKMFPWTSNVINSGLNGYTSQNWIDTLMPNSAMRDFFNSMNMDDRESAVYNSKLSAIAAAYYHGDLPDNYASLAPYQQQAILDRIENNAKSNLIIKGILSFFLPLAPTVSNDYYDKNLQTLRSEYLNLLKTKNPATGVNYTLPDALDKFLAEHGNGAISYTVARTESESGGATVALTDQAMNFINNNQSLLNNPAYSNAAPYLIPYSNTSSPDALKLETDLVAKGFRSKVTPQAFLNNIYIQKGWTDLGQDYKDYQNVMNQARSQNNRYMEYQASQAWKILTADYGTSNPIWYADYTNPSNLDHAQNAVSEFQKMNQNGLLGKSVIGQKIQGLLAEYDIYHKMLLANTLPNGQHTPQYGMAQDAWYTFMDQTVAQDPSLTSVVNSVFRRVK